MILHPFVLGGVGAATGILYFLNPAYALVVLGVYLALIVMLVKQSGIEVLMTPLAGKESLAIVATASKKLKPEIMEEDEGYLQRKLPEMGRPKIVDDTEYTIGGKRCHIVVEGIGHTVRLEWAVLLNYLWRIGINSPEELADVLGIPTKMIRGGKSEQKAVEKPKKPQKAESTGIKPVSLGTVFPE